MNTIGEQECIFPEDGNCNCNGTFHNQGYFIHEENCDFAADFGIENDESIEEEDEKAADN